MYKLILVDDEPRVRRGLARCIPWAELGFALEGEAANGREALALIQSIRPHLVITDIRMPDMDGLELIEAVRNAGIHSLILIVSGYGDFAYAQRAIRFGVTDYLLKPIEEEQLYDRILSCTQRLELSESMKAGSLPAESGTAKPNPVLVRETLALLETEYPHNPTLTDLAEKVAVHPNYLSALFTKSMGEPFSRYLARLRIEKSKALLDDPRLKVYEVAERVGYSDYRWFSKLFKQFTGITPAEYRAGVRPVGQ